MKLYWELFITFFRIGAFTFGGGYAMIPLIEREIVEKKKWVTSEEILNIFAISQSIPGAIALNSATLVGYKTGGRKGALASTLGIILPSFIIISIIAVFYERIDSTKAEPFFLGINGAIIALIVTAVVRMFKAAVYSKTTLIIYLIAAVFVVGRWFSPIFIIILSTLPGLIMLKVNPEIAHAWLERGEK